MGNNISIICRGCGAKLFFQEEDGWQAKLVVCPHCGFKEKASSCQRLSYAPSNPTVDNTCTQLSSDFMPSIESGMIGVIKVKETGRCHQLQMGTNIIGRVAKTGTADIKISTDPYMSRSHLRIDVIEGPLGIEHHLIEIGATNNVILNGSPIKKNEKLVLEFGDKMVLGKTIVSFEKPTSNDEEGTCLVNT